MLFNFKTFVAASLALWCAGAQAGSGAFINAFIYTEDPDLPPVLREKPFTITWLPNPGNHNWCMNEWGETTRMEVNFEQANPKRYQPEMICTYIGYVEEKGTTSDGDVCYSDTSAWALDYVVDSEDDSRLGEHAYAWGSFEWLESITRKSNEMYVKSPEFPKRPENISMSTSEEYRVGSRTEWPLGTQGPLWIFFRLGDLDQHKEKKPGWNED